MTNFVLPAVFNFIPTRGYINTLPGIEMPGVATKVARNIYIRNRLAEAQNWRCCWCQIECRPEPDHKDSATIEHIICRSHGGQDHPLTDDPYENYAMACSDCNHRRGNTLMEDFLEGRVTSSNHPDPNSKKTTRRERAIKRYIKKAAYYHRVGWVNKQGETVEPEMWFDSLKIAREEDRERIRLAVYEKEFEDVLEAA